MSIELRILIAGISIGISLSAIFFAILSMVVR